MESLDKRSSYTVVETRSYRGASVADRFLGLPCMGSGILIVVAYHMSEWRQFKSLLKGNKADILILLVTFFLTVFFDLVIAIQIGIIISSFVLMKRMSDATTVQLANDLFNQNNLSEEIFEEEHTELPEGVTMFEIHGPLFFGATQTFQDTMARLPDRPKVLILRMRHVPFVDATGIYRLFEIIKKFADQNTHVILSGVNEKVLSDLEKADIYTILHKKNITPSIDLAAERAKYITQS